MSSLRVVNGAVSPLETPPSDPGWQPDIGTNDHYNHGFHQQHRDHQLDDNWKPSPLPSASNSPVLTNAILQDVPSFPVLPNEDSMYRKPTSTASPRVFDLQQESPSAQYTSRSQLDLLQSDLASIQENETQHHEEDEFDLGSFDLKPPPPPPFLQNGLETLMDRLHSSDHLDIILSDTSLSAPFFRFIETYRPAHLSSLKQYLSARKALAALELANALAGRIPTSHQPYIAATPDPRFEGKVKRMVEEVLEDALPAYVTYRLVRLATDSLVKEITGAAGWVRTLIPDLATVYCVSDPGLADNPIVYASEEFHSTTLYSPAQCLNRNCRFLQGPHTSQASIRRLVAALTAGKEISETILNYRRDGSPFVNLLMIAPLYDNKGAVRYFLGCQIDVSALVEEGKGLESFSTLLARDRDRQRHADDRAIVKDPDQALSDLVARLSVDDYPASTHHRTPSTSINRLSTLTSTTNTTPTANRLSTPSSSRQRLVLTDEPIQQDPQLYPHISLGPSGRLPGVYQNYLLVRPFPSLRITFLSPSLRIPGLLQSAFLDHIAGPESIRDGLKDAFARGIGVTAKILWNSSSSTTSSTLGSTTTSSRGGDDGSNRRASQRFSTGSYASLLSTPGQQAHPLQSHPPHYTPSRPSTATTAGSERHHPGYRPPLATHPKSRWIHCTPLMGSDGRVGVWMVVMVEEEGGIRRTGTTLSAMGAGVGMQDSGIGDLGRSGSSRGGTGGGNVRGGGGREGAGIEVRDMATERETDSSLASSPALERDLYAEYLRSESRAGLGAERPGTSETSGSLRGVGRRDVDELFRGF